MTNRITEIKNYKPTPKAKTRLDEIRDYKPTAEIAPKRKANRAMAPSGPACTCPLRHIEQAATDSNDSKKLYHRKDCKRAEFLRHEFTRAAHTRVVTLRLRNPKTEKRNKN